VAGGTSRSRSREMVPPSAASNRPFVWAVWTGGEGAIDVDEKSDPAGCR